MNDLLFTSDCSGYNHLAWMFDININLHPIDAVSVCWPALIGIQAAEVC